MVSFFKRGVLLVRVWSYCRESILVFFFVWFRNIGDEGFSVVIKELKVIK